jgi:release factor glutamine methyltransferase
MGVNIQTIKDIRFYLAKELNDIYEEPEISALASIIIKTVIGTSKLHQLYMERQPVTIRQSRRITEICKELTTGKPLQYILGETNFYNCVLKLNSATLIPRPETEELVDLIIKENKGSHRNIIDFGTGSGCIAIALSSNLPGSVVTGIDISDEAITIARENALLNEVAVSFLKGDILNFEFDLVNPADIIVSNPPYVRYSEKQYMSRNVLEFEPHSALFVSDSDPLLYYNAIVKLTDKILLPGGRLYFEINEAMGKAMVELLVSSGYNAINLFEDINGKKRFLKGTKDV